MSEFKWSCGNFAIEYSDLVITPNGVEYTIGVHLEGTLVIERRVVNSAKVDRLGDVLTDFLEKSYDDMYSSSDEDRLALYDSVVMLDNVEGEEYIMKFERNAYVPNEHMLGYGESFDMTIGLWHSGGVDLNCRGMSESFTLHEIGMRSLEDLIEVADAFLDSVNV